jgi:catalase
MMLSRHMLDAIRATAAGRHSKARPRNESGFAGTQAYLPDSGASLFAALVGRHSTAGVLRRQLTWPPEEPVDDTVPASPALSQITDAGDTIVSRKVAVLAADGVDVVGTQRFTELMQQRSAVVEVLAPVAGGSLEGGSGGELRVDRAFTTVASVLYDAVVVACGPRAVSTLATDGYAVHFVVEAYKHRKPISAFGAGIDLLRAARIETRLADDPEVVSDQSVVTTAAAADTLPDEFVDEFAAALAQHRCWQRHTDPVPAWRFRQRPSAWV